MTLPHRGNADGETRTRKGDPHAPQACAYTNSATSAFYADLIIALLSKMVKMILYDRAAFRIQII
jgi:hypothetical protein